MGWWIQMIEFGISVLGLLISYMRLKTAPMWDIRKALWVEQARKQSQK